MYDCDVLVEGGADGLTAFLLTARYLYISTLSLPPTVKDFALDFSLALVYHLNVTIRPPVTQG